MGTWSRFGPVESFWNQFLLSQVINWLALDSGCTDFWRILRPKMEKMGTLKKNGDQKSYFGMGTNVGAVQKKACANQI